MDISERLGEAIERSLPKAAAACDAWMITAGVNGGPAKLVGNGVRTYGLSLYTIGIPAWGMIHPRVSIKRLIE